MVWVIVAVVAALPVYLVGGVVVLLLPDPSSFNLLSNITPLFTNSTSFPSMYLFFV